MLEAIGTAFKDNGVEACHDLGSGEALFQPKGCSRVSGSPVTVVVAASAAPPVPGGKRDLTCDVTFADDSVFEGHFPAHLAPHGGRPLLSKLLGDIETILLIRGLDPNFDRL